MGQKKILMACANHWRSPIQVGAQHLARGFSRLGWQVGYVSDPISPLHICAGFTPDLHDRWCSYRNGGQHDAEHSIWSYVPGVALTPHNKPILRTRLITEHWACLSFPRISNVVAKNGFAEVDLLYCDRFIHRSWFHNIRYKRSVYRMSDNNAGFQRHGSAAQAVEKKLVKEVDLVVYTARSLEDRVKGMQPKTMLHLPNGIDVIHFAKQMWAPPVEYSHIAKPIAIYVGSLDVWFDYSLINQCVKSLPDVSFVIIGPDQHARKNLVPRDNLHILGAKPYSCLPAYLHHADVGLIPFDVVNHYDLVRTVNPLKLYEYMACGLPVVATEWDELRYLNSPATLCKTAEHFISGIRRALWSPICKSVYQQYATDKDWNSNVENILSHLDLRM